MRLSFWNSIFPLRIDSTKKESRGDLTELREIRADILEEQLTDTCAWWLLLNLSKNRVGFRDQITAFDDDGWDLAHLMGTWKSRGKAIDLPYSNSTQVVFSQMEPSRLEIIDHWEAMFVRSAPYRSDSVTTCCTCLFKIV